MIQLQYPLKTSHLLDQEECSLENKKNKHTLWEIIMLMQNIDNFSF